MFDIYIQKQYRHAFGNCRRNAVKFNLHEVYRI